MEEYILLTYFFIDAIARRIAALTLGVLKSGEKFKSYGERRNVDNKKIIS